MIAQSNGRAEFSRKNRMGWRAGGVNPPVEQPGSSHPPLALGARTQFRSPGTSAVACVDGSLIDAGAETAYFLGARAAVILTDDEAYAITRLQLQEIAVADIFVEKEQVRAALIGDNESIAAL